MPPVIRAEDALLLNVGDRLVLHFQHSDFTEAGELKPEVAKSIDFQVGQHWSGNEAGEVKASVLAALATWWNAPFTI